MKVNLKEEWDLNLEGRMKFVTRARQGKAFQEGITTWIKTLRRVALAGTSAKKPRKMGVTATIQEMQYVLNFMVWEIYSVP